MPTIIPIPAFADNYIWALREGGLAAVVDPGDAAPVIAYLERERLTLSAILATHHHGDHVGGIRELTARWSVPVFGPAHEAIPGRTRALAEGDAIVVPGIGIALSVLDIPGHTSGHIAFAGNGVVFCGDTLFAAGCGRLFEGTPAQMLASLDKLAALARRDAGVLRARIHGVEPSLRARGRTRRPLRCSSARRVSRRSAAKGLPTLPSMIAEERTTNPFLRAAMPPSAPPRSATRAVRSSRRWPCLPNCGPGRTAFDQPGAA